MGRRRLVDILKIATDYYTELYKNNTIEREIDLPENESVPYIMQEETEKAIDTQKNDKAPGSDGISKQTKTAMTPILTEIFNVINTEMIPKQWTESTISICKDYFEKNRKETKRTTTNRTGWIPQGLLGIGPHPYRKTNYRKVC